MGYERVTLYGLPVVARRRVGFARIDPALSRELFIRHALVEGNWSTRHRFFHENARLRAELEEMEERARRRDLLAGDDELHAWYDARLPDSVVSARHFDAWWKQARRTSPDLLSLTRADLLRHEQVDESPDTWRAGDLQLPVTYRFEPGAADDGVTVHVPVDVLARLGGEQFAWQVPALREELVTALIRSLPKELRRHFVPAPDTARAVLAAVEPGAEPLLEVVQRELQRRTGVLVPLDAFDLAKLPTHLRVTFAVEDEHGTAVARGKDLAALQEQLAAPVRAAVAAAVAGELERSGLRDWPAELDELPRHVERASGAHTVHGYPALVDAGDAVDIRVFASPGEQAGAMRAGTRRLLRLTLPSPVKAAERALTARDRLVLNSNPDGSLAALLEDCADAAADALVPEPAWTRAAFTALRDTVAAELPTATARAAQQAARVLAAAHEVRLALPDAPPQAQAAAIADVKEQLRRLLPPGFVTRTGTRHLADLARYVTATGRRLQRLPHDVETDRARMQRVHIVQQAYDELLRALPPGRAAAEDVRDIGWLIEELRVSLWAQQLGTARPVSERRIFRAIDAIAL
jgi:ATP-dependent helicase HrpA